MLNPSRPLVISLVHPAVRSVVYPASGSAFVARTQGAPIVQLSGRPRTRPRAARRRREAAELPAGCTSYVCRGRQGRLLLPKRAEVQNEVRDARLQRQGEPRRRRHVAGRLRAEEVDLQRRGQDSRVLSVLTEMGRIAYESSQQPTTHFKIARRRNAVGGGDFFR